jgi:hypothetical protein
VSRRVLIVGRDHPHKGKTGTLTGETTRAGRKGSEMALVELDSPGIGGATCCYAVAEDLQPVASDYRGEAA